MEIFNMCANYQTRKLVPYDGTFGESNIAMAMARINFFGQFVFVLLNT